MPEILTTVEAMRRWRKSRMSASQSVALVPTMGALHSGHLALVKEALCRADRVVVSIFVNPLQFGPNEDLSRYPRTWDEDLSRLEELGAHAMFFPSESEMYPNGPSATRVEVMPMSSVLCGRVRPTHFQGVTTVVAKLLNIVSPDWAVFGEKDWQQLTIIRQMVEDLNFPTEIVGVPTVREESGLAMSSRNWYLSEGERDRAAAIFQGLQAAKARYASGERRKSAIRAAVEEVLATAAIEPEYVEVVHPRTLEESAELLQGPVLVAVAAPVGRARLIDNIMLSKT